MRLIAYALCVLLDVLAFACYDDGSIPGWNCAALPTVIERISAPGVPDDDPPIDLNCPSAARIHAALISVIRRTVRALWATAYCAPLMRILQYIQAARAPAAVHILHIPAAARAARNSIFLRLTLIYCTGGAYNADIP